MVSGLKSFLKSLGVVSAVLAGLGLLYSLLTRYQRAPVMRFSPPTDQNMGRPPAVTLKGPVIHRFRVRFEILLALAAIGLLCASLFIAFRMTLLGLGVVLAHGVLFPERVVTVVLPVVLAISMVFLLRGVALVLNRLSQRMLYQALWGMVALFAWAVGLLYIGQNDGFSALEAALFSPLLIIGFALLILDHVPDRFDPRDPFDTIDAVRRMGS